MGSLIRRVSLLYLPLLSRSCGVSHLGVLSYLSVMWADSLMFRSCCQVLDCKGASHECASNLNGERGAWVPCLVTLFRWPWMRGTVHIAGTSTEEVCLGQQFEFLWLIFKETGDFSPLPFRELLCLGIF